MGAQVGLGLSLMVAVVVGAAGLGGQHWLPPAAQPTCVNIPANMSLCHNIGYLSMRLPNLLNHDSLEEVCHQAASWVPLLNLGCHPDSRLFLCSLFSPVCLERAIYPCRSLCQAVRQGCEARINKYGFPWPEMFHCDKFPVDNNMCIAPQSLTNSLNEDECRPCNQPTTYENILDNYCRADFAIRTRIRRATKHKLRCTEAKVFKGKSSWSSKLKRPVLLMESIQDCCASTIRLSNVFLIMGYIRDKKLIPSFIMPWQGRASKPFKRAIRKLSNLNCTDPNVVARSVVAPGNKKSFNRMSF